MVYTYFNFATAGQPGYSDTTNLIGGLNGLNSAGAILGCGLSAWAADFCGEEDDDSDWLWGLVVGGALCAGSESIGMFYVGSLDAGTGSGTLAVVVVP